MTLDSGYPISTFKKVYDLETASIQMTYSDLTLPSYDISKANSDAYFWHSTLLDSGQTEYLYFCYEIEGTVFLNTSSASYSMMLLIQLGLLPGILFFVVTLIRYWYGQDVTNLYYTALRENEDLDSIDSVKGGEAKFDEIVQEEILAKNIRENLV